MSLKQIRIKSGLKAEFIANQLGITRQAYRNYETRKNKPSFLAKEKLAIIFKVNYEDIEKSLED